MLTPHGDEKGHLKGTIMTDVDTHDLLTVVVSGAADTHISRFTLAIANVSRELPNQSGLFLSCTMTKLVCIQEIRGFLSFLTC